ncbi:MAG: hypothetical protein RR087_09315, partial [Oscillospiraceae bacterium]
MRKILAMVLALVLSATLLASCGSKGAGGMEKVTLLYPGDESDRMSEFMENEFAEKLKTDLN